MKQDSFIEERRCSCAERAELEGFGHHVTIMQHYESGLLPRYVHLVLQGSPPPQEVPFVLM